jgi:hypothetical protein
MKNKAIQFFPMKTIYTIEHYNPHKVRLVFNGNVTDKSIKTHTKCANLNVHRCICENMFSHK